MQEIKLKSCHNNNLIKKSSIIKKVYALEVIFEKGKTI